ncbi:MAG: recN, partial [Ilumatobacteraceae bacterium]|nr:recN [Ilumatobacteraceae bacterium]
SLEALEELLAGAQAHRESAAAAIAVLADDGGAVDLVNAALAALGHRGPFAPAVERLRAVTADLTDLAAELRAVAESVDDDPARLAAATERRQLLRNLRRKYGETLADVVAFHAEVRARLDELEGYDQAVTRLEAERSLAHDDERRAAATVGARRRASADELAKAVELGLRELAMPRARVEVSVGDHDPGDDVTFLLAANPGSPALPLTKVASGGELARTMLALRLVLIEAPGTLVFDEVDAGIGGAAATAVGEALARLGRTHQVFAVTHLAQVAAMADHQILVSKEFVDDATVAVAEQLDDKARIAEIARMLSGTPDSEAARGHAAELLQTRRPTSRRSRRAH